MTIKRFAQRSSDDSPRLYWYDVAEGTRICCDEDVIMKLWCEWVLNKNGNSKRADINGFTVFEFINPIECDLAKMENWAG